MKHGLFNSEFLPAPGVFGPKPPGLSFLRTGGALAALLHVDHRHKRSPHGVSLDLLICRGTVEKTIPRG